jgi:hypothetical protein
MVSFETSSWTPITLCLHNGHNLYCPGWYPFLFVCVYNQLQTASGLLLAFATILFFLSLPLLLTWPYMGTNPVKPNLTCWVCSALHTQPKRKSALTFWCTNKWNKPMVATHSNQVCATKVLIWTGSTTWAKVQTPSAWGSMITTAPRCMPI